MLKHKLTLTFYVHKPEQWGENLTSDFGGGNQTPD